MICTAYLATGQIINEDFNGSAIPAGWTTQQVAGTANWEFGSGDMPTGADFATNAAIINPDANGAAGLDEAFLLSPIVDTTPLVNGIEINFDYALQDFAGDGDLDADVFDGTAWVNIFTTTVDEVGSLGFTDITQYSNANFQVRFRYDDDAAGTSIWGAGIDNVVVRELPTCVSPSAVTADNVTGTSVDLSWTSSETEWEVEIVEQGTSPNGTVTVGNLTTTSTTINSGLVPGTIYEAYVRAVCSATDISFNSQPATFRVPGPGDACAEPIALTVNAFGDCSTVYNLDFANSVDLGTSSATCDAVGTNTGKWFDFTAPASASIVMTSTGTTVEFALFDGCGGTQLECVSSATTDSGIITGLTPGNNYKLMVWKDGTPTVTTDICLQAGPTCLEPTALDAANVTDTTADLSWTSGGSGETAWDIEVVNITAGQTVTGTPQFNGVNNPYPLTGLTPATVYEYYVRANCGGGDTSTFGGPFQFRTDGPLDNCATAQTLTVEADCATATPYSLDLAAAGDLGPISGCDTAGVNTGGWFEFTTGTVTTITINTSVAMEIQILDACGGTEVACESSSSSHIISGLMANTNYKMAMWVDGTNSSTTDICIEEGPTCFVPTDLDVANVTQTTADLSWTAPTQGTTPVGYNVEVVTAGTPPTGTPTDINVVSGFTKSGLSSNTQYDIYVYADCGNNDISDAAGPESFTTSASCGDTVYDSGGPSGDYSITSVETYVFIPNSVNDLAQLEFQLVDLETCCDEILIYDGLDTNAPLIDGDVPNVDVSAGDSPIIYTATNADGALTLVLDSDISIVGAGFEVLFNCVARPACENPSDLAVTVIDGTSAEFSWTAGLSGETQWDLAIVPEGATAPTSPTINDVTTNPYTDSTLTPGTRYDVYLRADCGSSNSAFVGPVSFRTPGPGDTADTSIGLTVETTCDATTQTVLDFTNAIDLGDVASCASAFAENRGAWYQFRPNRNTSAVYLNSSEDVQYALFTVDGSGNANVEFACGTLTGGTQLEVGQLNFRDDYKLVVWDDSGALTSTNICIEDGPSCPTPIDLGITNVTPTTADFIWTPGSSNQTSFDVVVTVPGGDPSVPADVLQSGTVTTNSFMATGLVVGDSYDFYVTGDCDPANAGTDVSMMAGPLQYTQVGPGESCAAAIRMTVEPDCATATPYTVDFSTAVDIGTNVAGCDTVGVNTGVFIDFVVPANGGVIVNMTGATMEYALFESCGGTEVLCSATARNTTGIISGLIPGAVYKMALWKDGATSGTSDICVQEAPSCLPVTDLDVTNITSSGGDVEWNLGDSSQNLFEIEIVDAGQPQTGANIITGVTSSPFTVNTLMPSSSYDVYVRADCGGGDFSDWTGPVNFDTACVAITPDYAENFDNYVPLCWSEAGDGDLANGPDPSTSTSNWIADGFANNGTSGSARIEIWLTNDVEWLITPEFDLSAGGYEVNFDVALTPWSGTGPDVINPDDQVQFLMSENGGPWTELIVWDENNVPSNTGDVVNLPITSTSSSVKFAFLATEGPTSGGDVNFYVDNFQVRTPPSCFEISNLVVSGTTTTTADISFDSGNMNSSGNFEYQVVPAGDPAPTGSGIAISDPAVTNGSYSFTIGDGVTTGPALNSSTAYDLYVREICGAGDASIYNFTAVSFNTECAAIPAPYFTDFENFAADTEFTEQNCWSQNLPNDFEWQIDTNGGTTSGSTGPSGAFSGSAFMYSEASLPAGDGDIAIVNSPLIDLGALSNPELSFQYHMYGETIVSLTTEVSTDGGSTFTQVDQLVGEQQTSSADPWQLRSIDLSGFSGQQIIVRFLSEITVNAAGDAFYGDVAIDDFRIDTTASTPGLDQASKISLYPNPVSGDILNLDMGTNVTGDVNIMIHNALGQMVRRENMRSSSTIELDGMSTLSDGMYFITVDAGGKQQTIKFLKE
ncbi:hypothetical protein BST97_11135 [Nonlabens spongiae]|uniref:MAM domain-containing protein n=2 Tax=Nonlabens spongiae TaxID=331648 RepID=A0A1W6MLV6_9FLAO|nr:hypothetical protein BST97_11135 [Nonlabens spongiae]